MTLHVQNRSLFLKNSGGKISFVLVHLSHISGALPYQRSCSDRFSEKANSQTVWGDQLYAFYTFVDSPSLSPSIAFRPSLFTVPHISLALAVWVSSIAGKKPHPQPCLLVPLFAKGIISERFALLCLNVASKNITQ